MSNKAIKKCQCLLFQHINSAFICYEQHLILKFAKSHGLALGAALRAAGRDSRGAKIDSCTAQPLRSPFPTNFGWEEGKGRGEAARTRPAQFTRRGGSAPRRDAFDPRSTISDGGAKSFSQMLYCFLQTFSFPFPLLFSERVNPLPQARTHILT